MKRRGWVAFGEAESIERRKILASSKSRHTAQVEAERLQRHHKSRMTVTEVDGVWVVFRSTNREPLP